MQVDDFIKERDIYSGRIGGLRARDEVSHFGESVNYYQDRVVPFMSFWQGMESRLTSCHEQLGTGSGV